MEKMAPCGLLFRNPLRSRTKLRRIRQRAPSYSQISQTLASIPRGSPPSNRHPHRSRQSAILEGTTEDKPKGSQRVPRAIRVQLRTKAYCGNEKCKSGRPIAKKRLRHGERRQRQCSCPPRRKVHQNNRRRTDRRNELTIASQRK